MAKCFVGDLAFDVTDDTLRRRFSEFGELREAYVCVERNEKDKEREKSKGYGFVVFCDEVSAELACTVGKQSGQRIWRVVDANQAKSETWLDEEYQLTPKVRDVRDHDILEWEATGRLGGRPMPW